MIKKIVCILLVACLLPCIASAADISDFNTHALVCGEDRLDESEASYSGKYKVYTKKTVRVSFEFENGEIDRIFVDGSGISFLAYSMAAIMTFDPSSDHLIDNSGALMSIFLLARHGDDQFGRIGTGEVFIIQKDGNRFIFSVGK